jgi:hypothetical protein
MERSCYLVFGSELFTDCSLKLDVRVRFFSWRHSDRPSDLDEALLSEPEYSSALATCTNGVRGLSNSLDFRCW